MQKVVGGDVMDTGERGAAPAALEGCVRETDAVRGIDGEAVITDG